MLKKKIKIFSKDSFVSKKMIDNWLQERFPHKDAGNGRAELGWTCLFFGIYYRAREKGKPGTKPFEAGKEPAN